MADLAVAHLPSGSPTSRAARDERRVRVGGCSASNTGVSASSTALPGPVGAMPHPSRMTSATGRRRGRACQTPAAGDQVEPGRDDAAEVVDLERRTADERAVDVGLAEQLGCVRGLDEPP